VQLTVTLSKATGGAAVLADATGVGTSNTDE
jgi:hypothetical protein